MNTQTSRMWKAQDNGAKRPRAWCRCCGKEFYQSVPADGLCRCCRRDGRRKGRRRL